MIIPTFFCFDNFESYSNGAITVWADSVAWGSFGIFETFYLPVSYDNFEEYADGSIAALTGGFQWAADGVFTTY